MEAVRAVATRWLSDDLPGFLEVVLTDSHGVAHAIHEKVSVLSTDDWSPASAYPSEIWIDAEVLSARGGIVAVRLGHSIESLEGRAEFEVAPEFIRAPGASNLDGQPKPTPGSVLHDAAWARQAQRELLALLNQWDPIGVARDEGAGSIVDEYDCLRDSLISKLLGGDDRAAIVEFLRDELTSHFGMAPSLATDELVDRVMHWWASIQ